MKFDVIIGNPPYHMSDAGAGVSAIPLYHKFVQQAKKLNPRFLTMIIPARWFAGGKGLDDFRNEMLNDIRLKTIVDFASSKDCFPGVDIAGGVCYFLWDRDYSGNCTVINRFGEDEYSAERVLNEFSIFIRNNLAIKIIKKVIDSDDPNLSNTVFSRNPFGFATKDRGKKNPFKDSIKLISSAGIGYVRRNDVQKNKDKIDKYKIIIGKVVPCNGEVGVNPKDGYKVTTRNRVLMPGEIHTDSYIMLSAFDTELEAKNFSQYMDLKFPRFLLHHTITSLNITKEYFIFVPRLYYSKKWTDERLYKRYGLTKDEIDFVESTIRPIESNNE